MSKPLTGWEELKFAGGSAIAAAVITSLETGYPDGEFDWNKAFIYFFVIVVSVGIGVVYEDRKKDDRT